MVKGILFKITKNRITKIALEITQSRNLIMKLGSNGFITYEKTKNNVWKTSGEEKCV